MTRCLLLSGSYGFVDLGRFLWRQDGYVVYNCCWPSPAQSFSGPSPVGLATIFYCLRFETSLDWRPLLIISRHGPRRKHPVFIVVAQLLLIKDLMPSNGNVFIEPLPSNCRYLQSHCLATGLCAKILWERKCFKFIILIFVAPIGRGSFQNAR
jgi:hypothetical protein